MAMQAPPAVQRPSTKQVSLGVHNAPSAAAAQIPRLLQTWQLPQATTVQQTPFVQNPERHWLFAVQVSPRPRSPMHWPPRQKAPGTQSPSPAQVVRQPMPSLAQVYGSHGVVEDTEQVPSAMQA
jgi:hypothetical protein